MKTLVGLWICISFSLLLRGQTAEWKYEAAYGVGYADYSEQGNYFAVESDWTAVALDLMVEAQGRMAKTNPYLRVRFTGSDQDTEKWKEQGVVVQENEMAMAGIDFNLGVEMPWQTGKSTFIPSVGIRAGYQRFVRRNFVRYDGLSRIYGPGGKVTENVQTYGIGGGVAFKYPLGENWILEAETAGYWVFYTYADNDGFNIGIEGEGGRSWTSSLSIAKKLRKPGQSLGLMLSADLQWREGSLKNQDPGGSTVEWPDNEWQILSLALFWRGEF